VPSIRRPLTVREYILGLLALGTPHLSAAPWPHQGLDLIARPDADARTERPSSGHPRRGENGLRRAWDGGFEPQVGREVAQGVAEHMSAAPFLFRLASNKSSAASAVPNDLLTISL
jgi:hypothetical protein